MSNERLTAIRAEALGKRYARRSTHGKPLWAVRDVSFTIPVGEAVAFVGGNGAGKSTLLKLLARITPPTAGRAELHGRVRALLEVGTGFHPDLTGRENAFLNGAFLGMRRAEVHAKLDEIAAFAEIESFLDMPVKHYSSGMYVRLAFAIAVHLEPDVLIVDEVLAVGDVAFQRRCLAKMAELTNCGRTIIFVTHNASAAERLCSRAIWLDRGTIAADGPIHETLSRYLESSLSEPRATYVAPATATRDSPVLLTAAVLGSRGQATGALAFGEPLTIRARWRMPRTSPGANYFVHIMDDRDTLLTAANTANIEGAELERAGEHQLDCVFAEQPLAPGKYHVGLGVFSTHGAPLIHERIVAFEVTAVPHDPTYRFTITSEARMALRTTWRHSRQQ